MTAGDGSVLHAATKKLSGSWGYLAPDGTTLSGKLNVHRNDITSTRCEAHAIIAGMYSDNGRRHQICDNQAAIVLAKKKAHGLAQMTTKLFHYGNRTASNSNPWWHLYVSRARSTVSG